MHLLAGLLPLAGFLSEASAGGWSRHDQTFSPDYVLRGTYDSQAAIACTTRPSVLINGTSPGPELRLQENRTTWVRVYNDMADKNLTVHWHGLSASVAPFSDGTPLVSQWPIPPLHFFDYELHPNVGEAGTYFYHSHIDFQAVSAAGPLIVDEEEGCAPPYRYDGEFNMFLSELYNKTDDTIVQGLQSAPLKWSGEPNTFLMNGKAYAPNDTALSNGHCGPEIFDVEPGKTYRFRAIGGAALALMVFEIEKHNNLSIIEADGAYTKPFQVSRIQAGPGQRFDFLLKTMSARELSQAGKTDFWIQIEDRTRPSTAQSYAILRYKTVSKQPKPYGYGSPVANATIPAAPRVAPLNITKALSDIITWAEYALEPLKPNGFPSASEVTRRIYINSEQFVLGNNASSGLNQWWLSNHYWSDEGQNTSISNLPYLVDIYRNGEASIPSLQSAEQYGGWDPTLNAWPARLGEVLEIVWYNVDGNGSRSYDVHPFHAHGGHYYDIGSGNGTYDPAANEEKLKGYSPVLRDTTYLYRYVDGTVPKQNTTLGWRAWRLRVEDAGVWMIHCHSLQHMIMGMQSVWIMGNAEQIRAKVVGDTGYLTNETDVESSEMDAYLNYKGTAYGNSTHSPTVKHYW